MASASTQLLWPLPGKTCALQTLARLEGFEVDDPLACSLLQDAVGYALLGLLVQMCRNMQREREQKGARTTKNFASSAEILQPLPKIVNHSHTTGGG